MCCSQCTPLNHVSLHRCAIYYQVRRYITKFGDILPSLAIYYQVRRSLLHAIYILYTFIIHDALLNTGQPISVCGIMGIGVSTQSSLIRPSLIRASSSTGHPSSVVVILKCTLTCTMICSLLVQMISFQYRCMV